VGTPHLIGAAFPFPFWPTLGPLSVLSRVAHAAGFVIQIEES